VAKQRRISPTIPPGERLEFQYTGDKIGEGQERKNLPGQREGGAWEWIREKDPKKVKSLKLG